MQHIQGISHHQLQMNSFTIDNLVLFIEAFINYTRAALKKYYSQNSKCFNQSPFSKKQEELRFLKTCSL